MPKRILIVNDDKEFATCMANLIDNDGYDAYYAFDGEEGYRMAQEFSPDLIVTDFKMPFMDGYDLAKKLREEAVYKKPIVLTSADPLCWIKNKYADIENYIDCYVPVESFVSEFRLTFENELQKSTLRQAQGQ